MRTHTEKRQMYRITNNKKQEQMQTNLSVELVLVTPQVAENYLRFNIKNRKASLDHVAFLSKEMSAGRFIENGESIIFDKYGELKDGQHRLLSIIKSGKSYIIPIVRGVESHSMATYDTGKNRSAADVLSLNGYKNTSKLATLIILINKYSVRKTKTNDPSGNRRDKLTNQQVLDYCEENIDWLKDMVTKCDTIYCASNPKILSGTKMALIAYLIGGECPSHRVYDFLGHIVGNYRTPKTAVNYLYNKIYNSATNKEQLNFYWILGVSIKAYNYFIDGNPSVRNIIFSVDQELPKVNNINN